jgi:hypothetical protein
MLALRHGKVVGKSCERIKYMFYFIESGYDIPLFKDGVVDFT